jgi:hypothetical protein
MAGMWSYVQAQTMNTSAYNWGMWMDMGNMPVEQHSAIAMNTMYTQLFYAANPGMLEAGKGAFDVSGSGIVVPADLMAAVAQPASTSTSTSTSTASSDAAGYGTPDNAASASPSADAASATADSASSNSGYSTTGSGYSSGAGQVTSSALLVGLVAGVVSFLAL